MEWRNEEERFVVEAYRRGVPIDIRARNIQGLYTQVLGKSHDFDFVRYEYRISPFGAENHK